MRRILLGLSVFVCLSSTAYASQEPLRAYGRTKVQIDASALDASSTSFSLTNLPTTGTWGLLMVYVSITDSDNSTTAINMSCTGSTDDNSTDYTLQDVAVAAGVGTSTNLSWTKNPSAITSPKRWLWRVDIEGIEDIECTFTDTGGAAADSITVTTVLATKG